MVLAGGGGEAHGGVGGGGLGNGDGFGNVGGRVSLGLGVLVVGVGEQGAEAAQGRLLLQVRGDGDDALLALVADLDGGRFLVGGLGGGVGTGHGCGGRHKFSPTLHDAQGLGKEAVTSDVHAVALVANGAGDAADL